MATLNEDAVNALRQHGIGDIPPLPASNEGLEAGFFGEAYRYLRAWLLDHGGAVASAKPSAIVLSRAIRQDMERLGAEVVPYFTACPDIDVAGRIYIANDDLTIVAEIPARRCNNLSSIAKQLGILGLDRGVHTVLRLDRGEMILSRDGVRGANSCVSIDLGALQRLTQHELERQIWHFHRKFTQTPAGYLLCWKGSPKDRVTIDQLERQISGLLAFYLGSAVGPDNITMEHFTSHGRLDVKVSGSAMVPGFGPCALELKVLRSRMASTAKKWTSVSVVDMIRHAREGVQQAVEYRADIGGKVAYLCCFDARMIDQDQDEIEQFAKENDVILRRYFMYDSPKSHRMAAAAATKMGNLLSGEVL